MGNDYVDVIMNFLWINKSEIVHIPYTYKKNTCTKVQVDQAYHMNFLFYVSDYTTNVM